MSFDFVESLSAPISAPPSELLYKASAGDYHFFTENKKVKIGKGAVYSETYTTSNGKVRCLIAGHHNAAKLPRHECVQEDGTRRVFHGKLIDLHTEVAFSSVNTKLKSLVAPSLAPQDKVHEESENLTHPAKASKMSRDQVKGDNEELSKSYDRIAAQVKQGEDPLIRTDLVQWITGLAKSTLDRKVKEGNFPKPIKKEKGRLNYWKFSVVTAWHTTPNT